MCGHPSVLRPVAAALLALCAFAACATPDPRGLRGNIGASYLAQSGGLPAEWSGGARYYLAFADGVPVLERVRIWAGLDGWLSLGGGLSLTSKTRVSGSGNYLGLGGRGAGGLAFYLGHGFTLLGRVEYTLGHSFVVGADYPRNDPDAFVSASGGLATSGPGVGAELILGMIEGLPFNFVFGAGYRDLSIEGEYEVEVRETTADDPGNRAAHQARVMQYPGTFSIADSLSGLELHLLLQF